eukprot:30835-Pelagococcus_subviridis.AAC.15
MDAPPDPPGSRMPASAASVFSRCIADFKSFVSSGNNPRSRRTILFLLLRVAIPSARRRLTPAARRSAGSSARIAAPCAPCPSVASNVFCVETTPSTRAPRTRTGCPRAHPITTGFFSAAASAAPSSSPPPSPPLVDAVAGARRRVASSSPPETGRQPSNASAKPSRNDSSASSRFGDPAGAPSKTLHRNNTCASRSSFSSNATSGSDAAQGSCGTTARSGRGSGARGEEIAAVSAEDDDASREVDDDDDDPLSPPRSSLNPFFR